MLLVKVGRYTINVDQVAAFIEEGDKTAVVFNIPRSRTGPANGSGSVDGLYALKLDGEASQQLRAWLERNTESGVGETPGFSFLPGEE